MSASSAKQVIVDAVQRLSDDTTIEAAMERPSFLQKIERRMADVAAGRVIPYE